MRVSAPSTGTQLFAPIDALAARQDGMVVAATSRVFGNEWDGGVTAMFDKTHKSSHMPCGCTDVVFLGQDSGSVALSCDDGNIVVMAVTSIGQDGWKPLHLLAEHDNTVAALSCSPASSDCLASCSTDHTCRLWQFGDGGVSCTRTLEGHHAAVWGVAHSGDGNHIATVGQDGSTRLWDVRSKDATTAKVQSGSPLYCVCWTSDTQIFVGGEDGNVVVLDKRALATPSKTLNVHKDSVRRIAVGESASGDAILASASDDCTVSLRSLKALETAEVVKPHCDYVRGMCWGKGLVVTGSWDKTVAHIQVA